MNAAGWKVVDNRVALALGTAAGLAVVAYLAAVRPILHAARWLDERDGR